MGVKYIMDVEFDADYFIQLENKLKNTGYQGKTINNISEVKYVSGVDISYPKDDSKLPSVAYCVNDSLTNENVTFSASQLKSEPKIPYKAGFLGHKEAEIMVPEINKVHEKMVNEKMDTANLVILVDGNGLFHPRKFGSACHIAYHSQIPTIGVAKNYLHIDGFPEKTELNERIKNELLEFGDYFKLDDTVAVVRSSKRTKENPKCQPIYVSLAAGVSNLDLAVEIVLKMCKYKIPEPIRLADKMSRQMNNETNVTNKL